MEDEFFEEDILGLDPKELQEAKKIAQKDIRDDNTSKQHKSRKNTTTSQDSSRDI